ncbi:MAG TPA: PspA/IM30 family protein [Blastocatellia bacterium]|jgi:phage shock protein A|nr:PspA/IM30 family protein [Blastocatellia bacterium]
MWNRVKRLFRSIFGGMIEKAEDPELILQQVIRDMHDKVPQMQNNVVQVMTTEKLLQKEVTNDERAVVDYDAKVKAALKQGRDDIARTYITAMQEKQASLERSRAQLQSASAATEQAKKFLQNYVLQVKKRTAEAQQLVNDARAARMQEQLSQTMATFQIGDEAGTFDEMRQRIQRRSAAAEARMELSTSGVEAQMQDIERESLNIRVDDALTAYKQQMGMVAAGAPAPPSVQSESEKSLGPAERQKALE